MRLAIILAAVTALAGAQQTATEITVPKSPAEVTLESTAKQLRDLRQAENDALQQARYELDKANKPLVAQIERLQDRIKNNQTAIQGQYNARAGKIQKEALVNQAQIPWLVEEVRKSAKLPDDAKFDVDTGKWIVQR